MPALAAELTPVVYSSSTAQTIIEAYAVKYGIEAAPLLATLSCESNYRADARGDFDTHATPTSFGVAQIHLPAHPDITREQALDPLWSIDWTARQFKAGRQHMWSCYRQLYEVQ